MSGYLQRLAVRTLDSESTVQPLIPARFSSTHQMAAEFGEVQQLEESAARAAHTAHESRSVDESETPSLLSPTPASDLSREKVMPPLTGEGSLPPASLEEFPGVDSSELAGQFTLPPVESVDALADLKTGAEDVQSRESNARKSQAPRTGHTVGYPSSAITPIEEELDAGPDRQLGAATILQPVSRQAAVLPSDETQVQTSVDVESEHIAGELDRPRRQPDLSLPEINQLAVGERLAVSPTLPTEAEDFTMAEPQPQPIIRVTIGRIEVRAVPSPPAPAPRSRTPRPAPALSLQDYLKQRNGGDR